MIYDEQSKTLTASEGKVLRRIEDGNIFGNSISLGYSYYIGGKKLDTPHKDVPEDFEEIDDPNYKPPTLEEVKAEVKKEIEDYDKSSDVNSFVVNGQSAWLTNAERTSYTASVNNAETLGEESIQLLLNGNVLTLPTESAKTMLAQVSRYADKCWIVTQQHLSDVDKLTSVDDVESYDYKADYPERLNFTL